jgi:hypothetical protein
MKIVGAEKEGACPMRNSIIALFVLSLLCLSPSLVLATSNPDTGPGCGLGKKLWEDWKGQKQILPQLLMSSTNVTGSYSFSITSGTSGCSNDGRIWNSERARLFIGVNYASLSEDMARGGGEHLASLATLMNVPKEYQPEFFEMAQEHYLSLLNAGEDAPTTFQETMSDTMARHPVLAKAPANR